MWLAQKETRHLTLRVSLLCTVPLFSSDFGFREAILRVSGFGSRARTCKVVDAVDPLVVALEREVRGRRRQAPHLGGWGGG